jgi:hypothetical protein
MTARREEIEAAVAAYNAANPRAPLPRNAARLLTAMFPAVDLYQGSLEAIAGLGFGQRHLPRTLPRLADAGLLVRQPGAGGVPNTYWLTLPPRRQP